MPASFFRTLEIDAADAEAHRGAIRSMRSGGIDGIVVRNVYTPAQCAGLCARLEEGQHGLVRMGFPAAMKAFFLGINLNLAGGNLGPYFQEAPRFAARLATLFAPAADLQARVTSLLSVLDDGRPYLPAPGPEADQAHMFTTLRAHMPGGFIPPHFDNEQGFRESYRFITPRIGADIFSFVLGFSALDGGGETEIFDLHHQGRAFRMADGPDDASHLRLDGVPSIRIAPEPGTMILFNSGRFLHRVRPVEGAATRWTACSFMAETRLGAQVLCWG